MFLVLTPVYLSKSFSGTVVNSRGQRINVLVRRIASVTLWSRPCFLIDFQSFFVFGPHRRLRELFCNNSFFTSVHFGSHSFVCFRGPIGIFQYFRFQIVTKFRRLKKFCGISFSERPLFLRLSFPEVQSALRQFADLSLGVLTQQY